MQGSNPQPHPDRIAAPSAVSAGATPIAISHGGNLFQQDDAPILPGQEHSEEAPRESRRRCVAWLDRRGSRKRESERGVGFGSYTNTTWIILWGGDRRGAPSSGWKLMDLTRSLVPGTMPCHPGPVSSTSLT